MSSIIQIITELFNDIKQKDTKDSFINFFIKIKSYFQTNEVFTNLFLIILFIFMIIIGFIIFMLNPYKILDYVMYPVIILYMLITGFILFFILLRQNKSYNKTFNLKLDLILYSINFGKIILFVIGIFLAFYIVYGIFISLITKSLKFSFLFTLLVILLLLSIINSYTNMYNSGIGDNKILNFVKDLVFYIPCLITDFVDFMIKDYKQTPSTVIILLIILIIICTIYILYNNVNVSKNTIILVDKPVYLNTNILNLSKDKLISKIFENKPFYERQLLKIQQNKQYELRYTDLSNNDLSNNDLSNNLIDIIKKIPNFADKYTKDYYNRIYYGQNVQSKHIEGFQSIVSEETIPIHMTLDDYDQYILKQALWSNPDIINYDISNNSDPKDLGEYINDIISSQSKLLGYYEWILLKIQLFNASNMSKYILGDATIASYHYGLSYWLYLNKHESVINKKTGINKQDVIFEYGNRPSMYYDNNTKELIVEYVSTTSTTPIVLYKSKEILYQRWNHIVMNYDYGIFDLFINGHLVYSNPNIVDFITKNEILKVGDISNSNIGGISYMYYFEEPIDLEKIKNLYIKHTSF